MYLQIRARASYRRLLIASKRRLRIKSSEIGACSSKTNQFPEAIDRRNRPPREREIPLGRRSAKESLIRRNPPTLYQSMIRRGRDRHYARRNEARRIALEMDRLGELAA